MKKIMTAIDNPKIYNKIKNEKNINIIGKDLIYKEAVLEALEKNRNIDIIILYEKIPGEINFFELLKKIKNINKKINIIIILENKNEKLEKDLNKINIKNIYLKNNLNSKKLIEKINNNKIIKKNKYENKNNKIEKINIIRLNKIKKIVNILKNKILKIKIIKEIDEKTQKTSKHNRKQCNKTIIILGTKRSGKTLLSLLIAQKLNKQKKNISIINLNINTKIKKRNKVNLKKQKLIEEQSKKYKRNKSILNILQYKKIKNKLNKNIKIKINKEKTNNKIKKYKLKISKNINNKIKKLLKNENKKITNKIKKILIKKINYNIKYFSGFNLILNNLKKRNKENKNKEIELILKIIEQIQKESDYTIIEIENLKNKSINEKIIKKADKIILVIEANYLGIKEGKEIIEEINYINKKHMKGLHICINKIKANSISKRIIKKVFNESKIISKIKYRKKLKNYNYNKIIKSRNLIEEKNIKNKY